MVVYSPLDLMELTAASSCRCCCCCYYLHCHVFAAAVAPVVVDDDAMLVKTDYVNFCVFGSILATMVVGVPVMVWMVEMVTVVVMVMAPSELPCHWYDCNSYPTLAVPKAKFDVSVVLDLFPFAFHSMFSLIDDFVVDDDSLDDDLHDDDEHDDESHYWYDDYYGVHRLWHGYDDHHHRDGRRHPYIVIPSWRMETNQDISHGTYQVNLILAYYYFDPRSFRYYQCRIFEISILLVISI